MGERVYIPSRILHSSMSFARLVHTLENVFKECGLIVSKPYYATGCCFEYAARKGDKFILLKTAVDFSKVTRGMAGELNLIAEKLSATPLIIATTSPRGPMGDDIAYKRYGIFTITPQTLVNVMNDGDSPLVEANPGGYFVTLDVETLLKKREELNLSRKELASAVGTSSKALYAYERGLARCTISVALRLESILGVPIVRRLELFKRRYITHHPIGNSNSRRSFQKVVQKLNQLGLAVTIMRRAPFDFIAKGTEGRTILGGIVRRHEKEVERRIDVIASIARVARVMAMVITEKRPSYERVVTLSELERTRKQIELSDFIL